MMILQVEFGTRRIPSQANTDQVDTALREFGAKTDSAVRGNTDGTTSSNGQSTRRADSFTGSSSTDPYNTNIDNFQRFLLGVDDFSEEDSSNSPGPTSDEIKEYINNINNDKELDPQTKAALLEDFDKISKAANGIKVILKRCMELRKIKGLPPVPENINELLSVLPASERHLKKELQELSKNLLFTNSSDVTSGIFQLTKQVAVDLKSVSYPKSSSEFMKDYSIPAHAVTGFALYRSFKPDSLSARTGLRNVVTRLSDANPTNPRAKAGLKFVKSSGKWVSESGTTFANSKNVKPVLENTSKLARWIGNLKYIKPIVNASRIGGRFAPIPVIGTVIELGVVASDVYSWFDLSSQAKAEKNQSVKKKLQKDASSARNDALIGAACLVGAGVAIFFSAPVLPALMIGGLAAWGLKSLKNYLF